MALLCPHQVLMTVPDIVHSLQAADLRAVGKDPYAYSFSRSHFAADLHKQFEDLPAGQAADTADPVSVAGRVRARRVLGKLAFISIEDDSGSIQLYVDKKALDAQEENAFKYAQEQLLVEES